MDPLDTCLMFKDDVGIRLCTCEGSRTRVDLDNQVVIRPMT
ncbi:hypothetical protein NC652_039608 [Populus alba x Populus x berolinensis]|uniref:Uncharacterized protein n=1 Tax=Populus alba x Populus x berolinensis TaxID=444605 RepID=A0AAD6LE45_9ROSI|nr:hypothetical protein NC651_038527 [Populus alba x Populus x berolinensis]KAJ6862794.1 hypothetical protein NC652_039608 [Populus alba x Populus x berolinensis]KAJ6957651.1 hypothetical protein NC653_039576 [Populus alba x Populus x berolinensis]